MIGPPAKPSPADTLVTVPVFFKPGKAVSVTPTSAAPKLISADNGLLFTFLDVGTYPLKLISVLPIRSHLYVLVVVPSSSVINSS